MNEPEFSTDDGVGITVALTPIDRTSRIWAANGANGPERPIIGDAMGQTPVVGS